MSNILIKKIKTELNDVFGITSIGKSKTNVLIYILAEKYRKMICQLLKDKLSIDEFERVKIVVSGPIIPAED